ncbi:MAG: DNA polymerase III subunit delta [Opitutaceae bacterium]|jgi:DNA polymerase-3 subunit delta|nr:DNA polymerase III subunit delta [Opitutaceae bacterium]
MSTAKPFIFVCGADDFLVNRAGKARFDGLAREVEDEFSREVLNGFANTVAEVEAALGCFRESVQTVSMFGGKRLVWLKDVNFLADSVIGRAESTLKLVEDLQELLAGVTPGEVLVLITAAPIDRRRAFCKWCEKTADFVFTGGADTDKNADALAGVIEAEARALGVSFGEGALRLLLARAGANTRLLIEETHKLATALDEGATVIEEPLVDELTPNIAEGDFFEAAEAFFSGDLKWTLAALHRHFFGGGDARPVIASLQNRNRLLLQVRALVDAGDLRSGPRGFSKADLDRAMAAYGRHFTGATEKSAYNLFTQHPFYLGKLADARKLPAMRRLIDNQMELVNAFEEIIRRPDDQEEVLREMAVRCLGA